MSHVLSVSQLTAARFGIGLPAALLPFLISPATFGAPTVPVGALPSLLLLALIPGLLALALYYRGLQRTPASAAAVAELAFPISALTINYVIFGATLTPTQLGGVFGLSGVLVAMSVIARTPAGVGVAVARSDGVLRTPRLSRSQLGGREVDSWCLRRLVEGRREWTT